jgi:predicted aldo/keto reductase-like oxidoreductase
MNRREFIGAVAAGLLAAPALGAEKAGKLPTRKLGRIGLRVPVLGFGSGSRFLMYKEEDKALEALSRAIELGINYIDTAHSYGDGQSETWIGRLMPSRRNEVILATKIPGRTADQGRREIELSLKRLNTDRLEVLHIHALSGIEDLERIEAKGGVLEALYEAREQKITKAIGITCHGYPEALKAALEHNDFDCVQMALNAGMATMADTPTGFKTSRAGDSSFERLALPVANRKKMGVIAMKVFGQEQLIGSMPVDKLLTYSLSLPVSLASLGMPKLEFVERNVEVARNFKPLSERERNQLSAAIDTERKLAMHRFLTNHVDT